MKLLRKACAATLTAQVLFVAPVFAQSENNAIPRLETMIVSASRHEVSLVDTASSVSLIDADNLDIINAEHISQFFNRSAGTWISRGNGQEHLTAIRSPVFTGAGACGAFLMAEDGIPLRAAGFCNVNELFDSHYEVAEAIEVFRGPHSALYGSNALFGGINVLLPAAWEDSRPLLGLQLSENEYGRLQYRQPFAFGRQTLNILGTATADGGYRDDSGYDQQKLSVKHRWRGDDLTVTNGITLVNLEQETAGYVEGSDAYKDESLSRTNPNPEAYRDVESMRAYSRWHWQWADGELTVTPYARANAMEFRMHFLPWQPIEENAHQSFGSQIQWRTPLTENAELFVGADLEKTAGALKEYQPDPAPFAPERFPQGTHYDYEVDARSAAMYGGIEWQALDRLRFEGVIRHDSIHYDYDNLTGSGSACEPDVDGCRFFRPADRTDSFDFTSAKAGMVLDLSASQVIFVSLGNAFRAPQAVELYRLQSGQGTEDLKPVQLKNAELGLRGEAKAFFYQISLFAMKAEDDIFQDNERRYISGAETTHRGVEYELTWAATDTLGFNLFGTYARHKYANNPHLLDVAAQLEGNDIDTAPRTMNTFTVNWQPRDALLLDIELTRMGSYYTDPENMFDYEGHNLLHVRGEYRVSKRFAVEAAVTNLFDTRYAERADVAFGNERYFPGEGRKLLVGLSYAL